MSEFSSNEWQPIEATRTGMINQGREMPLHEWRAARHMRLPTISQFLIAILMLNGIATAESLDYLRVSDDGTHFVHGKSGERFIVWGVNYDHDGSGRLLDEYWIDEWETVVEDFREIKALGANCVRIHLQVGKLMDAPDKPNTVALKRLALLVNLAEDTGVYLDLTGLACYHKKNIPAWYDALSEQDRWAVQAAFGRRWHEPVKTVRPSSATT